MRREKKERMKNNLETIVGFFNKTERQRKLERALERMNRRKREQAMINEQEKKFVERGGKVEVVEIPDQFDFTE